MALSDMPISELEFKAGLCGKIACEARAAGDPKYTEAIRQQRVLNDERARRIAQLRTTDGGVCEHARPPVVIGMRSADMRARCKRPSDG